MRISQLFGSRLREIPAEADTDSHRLLLRAGMISQLVAGVYSYMPLALRALRKIENIVRDEMNKTGAQEVQMPSLQPIELWQKSGRDVAMGQTLFHLSDRKERELVLGPTHEEIITDLVANNVKSYKELPLILYQIQTKFRDEPRPRFGIMRTSEFIMKDAYSFDCDTEGLEKSYKKMFDAYCRIFERCSLPYIAVEADPGIMGGNISHEFMIPTPAGEDRVVVCGKCKYSASTEVAKCKESGAPSKEKKLPIAEVETPGIMTIDKVSGLLKVGPERLVKTLIYKCDDKIVALLLRGDFGANEAKVKNYLKCASLELADAKTIEEVTGAPVGFSGPVKLRNTRIIADNSVKGMVNFVAGANKKDAHLINVNIDRDFETKEFGDFRMITETDGCPACGKPIQIKQAIEVGHTFKLGTKYSDALGAKFLDKDGTEHAAIMGCYGIGVNRIMASLIETSNDKDGIIWPLTIAPYSIIITALNMEDKKVREVSEDIHGKLIRAGYDCLFDDRNDSAGVKFKDADLLGIPIKVIVGARNAKKGVLEIKDRKTGKVENVGQEELLSFLKNYVRAQ